MSPHFVHDCSVCVFLGQDEKHDFYFCEQGSHPTVIARFGSEGPDYTSGLLAARAARERGDFQNPLAKALTLAEGTKRQPVVSEPIPDYGDHMPLQQFVSACAEGSFIDYDGTGYYASGTAMYPSKAANPSDIVAGRIDTQFTHVMWFNK